MPSKVLHPRVAPIKRQARAQRWWQARAPWFLLRFEYDLVRARNAIRLNAEQAIGWLAGEGVGLTFNDWRKRQPTPLLRVQLWRCEHHPGGRRIKLVEHPGLPVPVVVAMPREVG